MKKLFLYIGIVFFLLSFSQDDIHEYIPRESFQMGETLKFKATFGFFTVGRGEIHLRDFTSRVNGRDCYKLDIYGRTTGFMNFVVDVDDYWGAYVDTASLKTHTAVRKLKEGRYRKQEYVKFYNETDSIEVKDFDEELGRFKEPEFFKNEIGARDMLAAYLELRTHDFSKLQIGDTIPLHSFIEDTFYEFKVVCYGRETLKTKAGKFKSVVFIPVMPGNSIFEGEDAIKAWFSDDKNRIPLKAEGKMFIGDAGIELVEFSGLRNKPALVN